MIEKPIASDIEEFVKIIMFLQKIHSNKEFYDATMKELKDWFYGEYVDPIGVKEAKKLVEKILCGYKIDENT